MIEVLCPKYPLTIPDDLKSCEEASEAAVAGSDNLLLRDLLLFVPLLAAAADVDGQLPAEKALFPSLLEALLAVVSSSVDVDAVHTQVILAASYAPETLPWVHRFPAAGTVMRDDIRLLHIRPYEDETSPAVGALIFIGLRGSDLNRGAVGASDHAGTQLFPLSWEKLRIVSRDSPYKLRSPSITDPEAAPEATATTVPSDDNHPTPHITQHPIRSSYVRHLPTGADASHERSAAELLRRSRVFSDVQVS